MGIFSSIGKAFKSVFKGIMKVFAPILKPLGKLMNSSLGKAIMIGLSIFTLGTAMVAGYGAFTAAQAAGQGFISAFVEGGKVFMSTLMGKGGEEAGQAAAEGAGQTAAAAADQAAIATQSGSMNPALLPEAQSSIDSAAALAEGSGALSEASTMAATSAGQSGSTIAGSGGMGGMPDLPVPAGVDPSLQASTGIAPTTTAGGGGGGITAAAEGSWLDKAKSAAGKFADYSTSEGGGQVVGSLISAAGNYYTEKDRQEFEDRVRKQWGKGTGDAGIRNIRAAGARASNMDAPTGVPAAGRNVARGGGGRPYFDRAYGAGAEAGAGG